MAVTEYGASLSCIGSFTSIGLVSGLFCRTHPLVRLMVPFPVKPGIFNVTMALVPDIC